MTTPLGAVERIAGYPVHPAASAFPLLDEVELATLAADIKANGLIHPIILDRAGEIIIDGRNRLRACELAGVEPRFERLNGADPEAFVVSVNVQRRNLTPQQRAILAARAWERAENEGRVQAGAGRPEKQSAQNGRIILNPRDHFAALYSVSKNYVAMARAVLRFSHGWPITSSTARSPKMAPS